MTKTCCKCKEHKPLSGFYKIKDGTRTARCKTCYREAENSAKRVKLLASESLRQCIKCKQDRPIHCFLIDDKTGRTCIDCFNATKAVDAVAFIAMVEGYGDNINPCLTCIHCGRLDIVKSGAKKQRNVYVSCTKGDIKFSAVIIDRSDECILYESGGPRYAEILRKEYPCK
jgi:hypothetical protein